MHKSTLQPLKQFIHLIEQRIPVHIKIVAELRLIWHEIVGTMMGQRSQIEKCELLPRSNNNEIKRRLIIYVKDKETQNALTTYSDMYLEKIPKKYRIHSLRFYYKNNKQFINLTEKVSPKKPEVLITEQEKQKIINKVTSLNIQETSAQALIDYFITWKNLQHKNNDDSK